MPRASVWFAECAVADLESMRAWYTEQGVPDVGERLLGEMVASIEALADDSDMGRIVPEFSQPFLRELIRPPFRIVYRREPKHVRIVRVWRSERLLEVPDGGFGMEIPRLRSGRQARCHPDQRGGIS